MAKIKIPFNNKNYSVDEQSLSSASDSLKSHLSTTMSGSGATINFGGTSYNVDSAKLLAATNDFISHLGIVAGNGYKVVVNGTEYSVGSDKVAGAVSDLEIVLGDLHTEDEGGSGDYPAAGLYQTGSIALYKEQGAEAIKDMLIMSWDEMVSSGAIVINNGVMSVGTTFDNLPEKNEYGFYFGVAYYGDNTGTGFIFYEDGSCDWIIDGETQQFAGSGSLRYSENAIDMSHKYMGKTQVVDDGHTILFEASLDDKALYLAGDKPQFNGDLILPNDDSIIAFAYESFIHNTLTGIAIPNSVTSIEEAAFYGCEGLSFISFAGTIEQWDAITKGDWWNLNVSATEVVCSDGTVALVKSDSDTSAGLYETGSNYTVKLKDWDELLADGTVHVDDGVVYTNMDTDTWVNSSSDILAGDLMLPNDRSITVLGESAFDSCKNLTGVIIPDSVHTISSYAFYDCSNLTYFKYGAGVTNIGTEAFNGCNITTFELAYGITTIESDLLSNNSAITKVILPESLTTIDSFAFRFCTNLQSVNIPNSVTSIGQNAFEQCTSLTNIILPESLTSLGNKAFMGCSNLTNVEICNNALEIGENAFNACGFTSIKIPNNITTINNSAFSGTKLINVTIPDSVTTIKQRAFSYSADLTSVDIPSSVTTIEFWAFGSCEKLTTINFAGTMEQWNAISKESAWNDGVPATEVVCSDGTVTL